MTGLSNSAAASPQHGLVALGHVSGNGGQLRAIPIATLTERDCSAAQFSINAQVVVDHAVRAEALPGTGAARPSVDAGDAVDRRDRLVDRGHPPPGHALAAPLAPRSLAVR